MCPVLLLQKNSIRMVFAPMTPELGKVMIQKKTSSPIIIFALVFFLLFCHCCGGSGGGGKVGESIDLVNNDDDSNDASDMDNQNPDASGIDDQNPDASGIDGQHSTDTITELNNGDIVSLSFNEGENGSFSLSVPSGATALFAELSHMNGDLDLYTRFGALPTRDHYDCRPYLDIGSSEICYDHDPLPDQVLYIHITAQTSGSATLKAVYQTGDIGSGIDFGKLPEDATPWSSWFWPWMDDMDPNLYDDDGPLNRYDQYTQSTDAQAWEYDFHGPPQDPDPWYGSCHAWAGAACWEHQPTESRYLGDIQFRIRDRKGLMTAAYYECGKAIHHEINASQPSPGLFWKLLQDEIQGKDPMHGRAYPLIGELSYGEQIWNHPIFRYEVNLSLTGNMADGTIKIWYTSDALPAYGDTTDLYYHTMTYQFTGVEIIGASSPADSGEWVVPDDPELMPYHRPDILWRPYRPSSWAAYAANPHLDAIHLADILD
jgi:hypothetical protein